MLTLPLNIVVHSLMADVFLPGSRASPPDAGAHARASPSWRSLTLALGIGATTTMFSVVYAMPFRPAAVPG
jgi:hypothetical protein